MPDDIDLLDAPAKTDGAGGDTGVDDKAGGDAGKPAASSADKAVAKIAADAGADVEGDSAGDGDDKPAAPAKGRAGKTQQAKGKADPAAAKGEQKPAAGKAPGPDGELGFDEENEDGSPKAPADWPDDWREKLSAGNEKLAKRLARFSSPEALLKSWQSLEQKLSSGEFKRQLAADASDEEKAAWRAENGIPDKPEGYELPTIKGHEWSDVDKTIANGFLADLHAADAPAPVAQAALTWYAKFQQQRAEAMADQDRLDIESREDALRAKRAPGDYRAHTRLAKDVFQDEEFMTASLRNAIAGARTADGRRLLYHPDLTEFLIERGLERRPGGLITGEQGARMGGRIDEIKKIMASDLDRYYAEGLDKELLELTEKVGSARGR